MFRYETENFEYIDEIQENQKSLIMFKEKLGTVNMCLRLSVQYMSQAFITAESEFSELLLKLSADELSNFEMFSRVARSLSGGKATGNTVKNSLVEDVVATGDPCTDLLSDIALEQQTKLIFESLYELVEEPQLKEFFLLLIAQTEEHSLLLREAFNKIQRAKVKAELKTTKTPRMCFGTIKPVLNENSYDEFKRTAPAVLGGISRGFKLPTAEQHKNSYWGSSVKGL